MKKHAQIHAQMSVTPNTPRSTDGFPHIRTFPLGHAILDCMLG